MRKHLKGRLSPSMGVALLALFIALGGTTYAATGGNFILGRANTATNQTSLSASVNSGTTGGGKALQVTNLNTGTGATALGLNVAAGKPPFAVNSGTKVANLNADKLDGKDSTQLSPVGGDGRTADLELFLGARTVLAANVTTSGSGWLLASAALQLNGTGDQFVGCYLAIDDSTDISPWFDTRIVETGRPIDVTSLAAVWAFPAGPGAHTVKLDCASSNPGAFVDDAGLIVSAHLA